MLGRELEEDLSLMPEGIKDFGVHDLGDPREGKRSPIDVAMEFGRKDFAAATDWLYAQLGGDLKAKLTLDPQDPMRSARVLVAANFIADDLKTLHRHRGAFWSWNGSYYRLADDEAIRSTIWSFLEKAWRREKKKGEEWQTVPFKPTRARVGDVLDALGAVLNLNSFIGPPAWLTPNAMPPANELLACGNGLLHLPTGKLYPLSPAYFNLNASEVAFDPDAAEPSQWLTFLGQLFGNDQQAIELLQDWFGYSLAPDTSQQKILLVVGPRRSGKGTMMRVMKAMLGQ